MSEQLAAHTERNALAFSVLARGCVTYIPLKGAMSAYLGRFMPNPGTFLQLSPPNPSRDSLTQPSTHLHPC